FSSNLSQLDFLFVPLPHPSTTTLYPLSLHDALPICSGEGLDDLRKADIDAGGFVFLGLYGIIDPPRDEVLEAVRVVQEAGVRVRDRKSTRLNSSHVSISYAVFCLKKKCSQF